LISVSGFFNEKKKNLLVFSDRNMCRDMNTMATGKEPQVLHGLSVETLSFFSDAVFAIAITLLAIDIRVPVLAEDLIATQFSNEVLGLAPKFVSFILTFFIIGSYWITYHRVMYLVKRSDRGLISLNLLFLMFVVLLPFPNDLIGKYPTQQLAVAVYAVIIMATGLSLCLLWIHASKGHRLIEEAVPRVFIRNLTRRLLISPSVFFISLFISFLNPLFSLVCWFCVFPIGMYFERRYIKGYSQKG
jgi:uncharacterized membrane protein